MLRIINIAEGTAVDGPGLRTSIYFAGCQHYCPGCHNPDSWSFGAGRDWSVEEVMRVIRYNRFPVTFSGGDPLYQAQNPDLIELARQIRLFFGEHPDYLHGNDPLWIYTGFRYEDVRDRAPYAELLALTDVLVDGPFLKEQRPPAAHIRFRGSMNQRFIRPRTGEELIFD